MNLTFATEAFVREARVARLATVDPHSRPHVVPVCFVYHMGCIYSALDAKPKRVSAIELRRVRNFVANPAVQLLIDRYEDDWSRLAYVQLRGRASLLAPGAEHAAALALLRAKYPQYIDMRLEDGPVIKVAVDHAVAWGEP